MVPVRVIMMAWCPSLWVVLSFSFSTELTEEAARVTNPATFQQRLGSCVRDARTSCRNTAGLHLPHARIVHRQVRDLARQEELGSAKVGKKGKKERPKGCQTHTLEAPDRCQKQVTVEGPLPPPSLDI